mmetsp:Transcript_14543/g.23112  ORF Transcript_14543/g.23112 Transcript_14543/m.23112 type:complete len:100 (+) Transcript_14543:137-436(+)
MQLLRRLINIVLYFFCPLRLLLAVVIVRCDNCLQSAVGERCGFTVDSDEFILMNQWEGPKTLQERVLKGLGDPFFQVPVPFKADSIVIDLQFRRRLQRS